MPKPRTRDRILDEALRLFALRGVAGTSISDIERAVGLAPGTGSLHRHFASKEAVLAEAVDRELSRLRTLRPERLDAPPRNRVELAAQIRAEFDLMRETRLLSALLMREPDHPVVTRVREGLVDRGLTGLAAEHRESFSGSGSVDAEAAASIRMAAVVGYFLTREFFPGARSGLDEDAFAEALAQLLTT